MAENQIFGVKIENDSNFLILAFSPNKNISVFLEFSFFTLSSKNSSKSGLNQATEMFRLILES